MTTSQLLRELNRLDLSIYTAIASSETPSLDSSIRALSHAADFSRISIGTAAGLALFAGPGGRRAAIRGLASIAVTSAVMNLAVKPLARRGRPDRPAAAVPEVRHVRMPTSHSFPSGHSAAAFAFATGAGRALPWTVPPLTLLATAVGYSRIHTGVHYPGDVIAGSLCGVALAELTNYALDRFSRNQLARRGWDVTDVEIEDTEPDVISRVAKFDERFYRLHRSG